MRTSITIEVELVSVYRVKSLNQTHKLSTPGEGQKARAGVVRVTIMINVPRIPLNDGNWLSAVGFGTWMMNDEQVRSAVVESAQLGYRLFDTAARYHNEAGVGQGIVNSGLPREDIQVTSKVRGGDQGYEETLRAFEATRRNLGLEYVDCYLIHWPLPRLDLYVETWKALIHLRETGAVRSIGVSNFSTEQIDRLISETGVAPAVNQIELHPMFGQPQLRADNAERGVVTQSWGPLGRGEGMLEAEPLAAAAAAQGVAPAQVALRWIYQLGAYPIPKSGDQVRRQQNLDIFDFELTETEMAAIATLESGRLGKDPAVDEEF